MPHHLDQTLLPLSCICLAVVADYDRRAFGSRPLLSEIAQSYTCQPITKNMLISGGLDSTDAVEIILMDVACRVRALMNKKGCRSRHSHPVPFSVESETDCIFLYSSSSCRCISKSAFRSLFMRCCSMSRTTPACIACMRLVLAS
jgi:hypothetical protein